MSDSAKRGLSFGRQGPPCLHIVGSWRPSLAVASVRDVPSFALLPGSPLRPREPLLLASPAVVVGQFLAQVYRLGVPFVARLCGTLPSFWLLPYRVALSVGYSPRDQEEPVTTVRGADGLRWDTVPFRIVPALGQRPENSGESPRTESWHVLHDDVLGSKIANDPVELPPEARPFPFEPLAFAGEADVLARKAAAKDVDGGCGLGGYLSDIIEPPDVGPVLCEHLPTKRITLGLPHRVADSCSFEPPFEPADPAEQRSYPHAFRLFAFLASA